MRCAFCKAKEADRSEYGVPICHDCFSIGKLKSNRKNRSSALVHDLTEATVRFEGLQRVQFHRCGHSQWPPSPGIEFHSSA